jgi:SAM-dependent methyltransferase
MFRESAYVYDLVYGAKDYEGESVVIRDQITTARPGAARVLDVACGTGVHLDHLRRWFTVAGVDVEPAMLAVARRRLGDDVPLELADMRDFDLGRRFDAVICLFSSIGYMPDTHALDRAVANMARHLDDGGVLIVDGWIRPEAWRSDITVTSQAFTDGVTAVSRTGRSQRTGNRTRLEMHHVVATADGIEHIVEHHDMTLFTDDDYCAAFERAALTVTEVAGFHDDRPRLLCVRPTAG